MSSKPVPTIKVLRAARKLVANEKTWIRGALAKRADGTITVPTDPDAVSWCVAGALLKAASGFGLTRLDVQPLWIALDHMVGTDQFGQKRTLIQANDEYGRELALAFLDTAIDELEAR